MGSKHTEHDITGVRITYMQHDVPCAKSINTMTKQVADLIHAKLAAVGDVIHFTFKKNTFEGIIADHGLIYKTTHNGQPIFQNRCFNSLTQWTETCIQDQLQEYHTRYSAWRRVKLGNKTMDELYRRVQHDRLREQHNLSDAKLHQLVKIQQQEACELKTRLEDAHTALEAWNEWYRNHYGATPPPVSAAPMAPPRPPMVSPPPQLIDHPVVTTAPAWNPPTHVQIDKLRSLDKGTVAAYAHAFFS